MGVKFTKESAQRIARVVQRVEGRPTAQQTLRGSYGWVQYDYIQCGKTLATSVKNQMANVMLYTGSASNNLESTGQQIDAWNRFGTIQAGRWVFVWTMPWGYEISSAEC